MNFTLEKLSGSKIKLSFTVEAKDFDSALDVAVEKKAKETELPGFRKGHVSKDLYVSKFGKEGCYTDALDEVINNSFYEAIMDKKLEVVGQPKVDLDITKVKEGEDVHFDIEVEIYPEVKLGQYKGLEVEKEKVKVTAKEVTEYCDRILEQHAELVVAEDVSLAKGHTAVFDFEGSVDGETFEGGKADNHSLEIGSGQFIPGFEDQMIGMKTGEEKDINVKFPENYQAENLKGKDAVFHVKLHEVKQRVKPELTDEFIKSELEIKDINTIAEYKKFVKELIKKDKEEASKNKFESEILEKLVAGSMLDVPEGMVEEELNNQVKRIENQAKMYGLTADQLLQYSGMQGLDAYKEQLKPSAREAVAQRVVLAQVAKAEKMEVSEKQYEAEINKLAEEVKKPIEELKKTYTLETIRPYILLQTAHDFVIKNAVDLSEKPAVVETTEK